MDQVKRNMDKESGNNNNGNNNSQESHEKQRQMLENELMRVSGQLELSHKVFYLEM